MSWKIALDALHAGRASEARGLAALSCQRAPGEAMPWHVSGLAALECGDLSAAVSALSRAVSLAPRRPMLRGPLGVALLRGGDAAAAWPHLEAADHGDPWLGLHRGIAAFVLGDAAEAVRILGPLSSRAPADPEVWRYLGLSSLESGDLSTSASAWAQLSVLRPSEPEGPTMLGMVLGRQGDVPGAIRCFRQALSRDASHTPAWSNLGARLVEQGDLSAATHAYEQAGDAVGLATIAERQRDLSGARAAIAPQVRAGAGSAAALDLWARLCRRQGDPENALMPLRHALRDRTDLDRSVLLHALADTLDALGDVDAAWVAWSDANASRRQSFDPVSHDDMVSAICSAWPSLSHVTSSSLAEPVFIVGMPRSGTSLLEQMLDAHPALRGVGERTELSALASEARGPVTSALQADNYCNQYIGAVGSDRTVDKMPHNFYHLGLLMQLFPRARVLYSVREPQDTCFSCFRQRFGAGLSYTTDLSWLGAVYVGHEHLMAHWSAIGVPIRPVRYAQLVDAPEETLRGVLSWLGLGWEPSCLRFHERQRVVATASFAQVQEPLYTRGIGRSGPYHRHLGPLRAALRLSRG